MKMNISVLICLVLCMAINNVSGVVYNLQGDFTKADTFNGVGIPSRQYPVNKVYTMGIFVSDLNFADETKFYIYKNDLIPPQVSSQQISGQVLENSQGIQGQQDIIEKDEKIDISDKIDESDENEENMSQFRLPHYELEYGREPLSFLLTKMFGHSDPEMVNNDPFKIGNSNQFGRDQKEDTDGNLTQDFEDEPNPDSPVNGNLLGVRNWVTPEKGNESNKIPCTFIVYLFKIPAGKELPKDVTEMTLGEYKSHGFDNKIDMTTDLLEKAAQFAQFSNVDLAKIPNKESQQLLGEDRESVQSLSVSNSSINRLLIV